ncbi:biopolymer transporter ExbD [Lentisphaera profundi]|uniref:Biopolymer transporter ExbD n=1 Tax=Lentisphaera profundi TaxID=1658616 RepID=A0ABY7VWL7_9BACT|nr:biopolymer transporter ExbD [Lentisphaera profundi]WDE97211.1 biopolymer transporter ExbD [Lentisphaera profundi]
MRKLYSRLKMDDDTQNVDMTPLIDMVFILLIFFIVTSVFSKDKGMDIERPSQQSAGKVASQNIMITLTETGKLRADGRDISFNSLRSYVSKKMKTKNQAVVIMADVDADVGDLADIMDECRLAGAKKISLATESE